MPMYLLNLFYSSVREQAAALKNIRSEIESMSGKQWRVLSAGEHICAIGFVTELPPEQMRERLRRSTKSEGLHFLLVEIERPIDGFLTQGTWDWLASHQAAPRP